MTSHAADCVQERAQEETVSSAWGPNAPTPGQLSEFFAQIKSGRMTRSRVQAILRVDIRTEWQDFYARILGIEVDFSEVQIPEHKPEFDRVLIIAHGLLISRALEACEFPHWCYWDDPDSAITVDERSAVNSPPYAIRVRDCVEADDDLKGLSAENIEERGIKTQTVLERVLHELKFFDETKQHLDIKNITLCAGSRGSDGFVPDVYWFSGKLFLSWSHPQIVDPNLRARAVVSL